MAGWIDDMSKHTPGPWAAHFEEAYFVTGPDLGRVAMMMNLKGAHGLGGRRTGDESAANARLIAAAPDLLEALQGLTQAINFRAAAVCGNDDSKVEFAVSEFWRAQDKALAAIAKATGET